MNPFKRPITNPASEDSSAPDPAFKPVNPQSGGAPRGGHAEGDPAHEPIGPDETEALITDLQGRIDALRGERDEWQAKHAHALADFANYQRRALSNEDMAREQGIRGVLQGIIPVIDHFELALAQDPSKASAEQVISGVTMIKDELLKTLSAHGVMVINPKRGDAFEPKLHEAVLQQAAEGVQPGHVVNTLRTGYSLADKVVRPAQVSIAP